MSFFGFDTTNPANPEVAKKKKRGNKQKKQPAVEEFDGDALDQMLEKKYAQQEGVVEEFDDEDNLETFEVDKQELGFQSANFRERFRLYQTNFIAAN